MPSLSVTQLNELLRRKAISQRNPELGRVSNPDCAPRKIAELESAFSHDALGATRLQKASGQSFRVRVCSVRHKLCDEDNLAAKFVVDQCRYSGYIPDDNPALTKIEVTQRKCEPGELEHVEIIIDSHW